MGKGDKRTRKGKIYRGSHGVTRPRKSKTAAAPSAPKAASARKTARKKAS